MKSRRAFSRIHLTLAVAFAIGAPTVAGGAPFVVTGNCFTAPAGTSCVSIGYNQGPFANPTDDREFSRVIAESLFGEPALLADTSLLGVPFPERTEATDAISVSVHLENDGSNDILVTRVSGKHTLTPAVSTAEEAESKLGSRVFVIGRLENSAIPAGTNLNVPIQIDHDGGISDVTEDEVQQFQNGSSLLILWDAQANLFTNEGATQTPLFSSSLNVNEQSLAIGTSGSSGPGYLFSDLNGDGFPETYDNISAIFPQVQIPVGEEFTLEVLVDSTIFSDFGTSGAPTPEQTFQHDFGNTFRLGLVLPAGTTFVPVPEPGVGPRTAVALVGLAVIAIGRRPPGRVRP